MGGVDWYASRRCRGPSADVKRESVMKTYETILTETIGDHLLKVTLNRPEVGNARNTQM